MLVQPLGKEDPLEEEMATHSSILAWEPVDRGAWRAAGPGVADSGTRLSTLCAVHIWALATTLDPPS